MKDEIKEILFLLHNDRLTESGKRKLEDYITNLQERNEKLNNIINELENFIETYAIPEFNLSEEPTRYFMETKIILDKLKELKNK